MGTLEPLGMTAIPPSEAVNPLKRCQPDAEQSSRESIQQISPVSESSSTGHRELLSSRADLQNYCHNKGHSLTWEALGCRRVDKQEIWAERVTVDGKYQAVGESSGRKKAQAAAAEAMIRSGVLEDFADFK
jgi:dsRNA-specific ribonuclease